MPDHQIEEGRIYELLMPDAVAAEERARANGRFVHYTSAQAAFDIFESGCLWLRNATCMNDYNEMKHGLVCVVEAFKTEAGAKFHAAFNSCHENFSIDLDRQFTNIMPTLLGHTYIACVSEHQDDEESYGRLSMWRAYGSATGVALVFNNGPFLRPASAFPIWVMPVAYIDTDGVREQIERIAATVAEQRELFAAVRREDLIDIVLRVLIFAVVSSKHKGFKEEREWRIVHLPAIWPALQERIPLDHVALGGVPQPIFKVPFVDYPDDGFYGATLPDLINRVIVGPTQYPIAIRTAFTQMLTAARVQNVEEKVRCSDISLRV